MTADDIVRLAQAGGVALSICLLLVGVALATGIFEWGPSVRRERGQWRMAVDREHAWGEQMQAERDDYKREVQSRQQAAEQALAIAQAQLEHRRENFR